MKALDEDWRGARIASFDLETTGLDPKKEAITEIGIVYFQDGEPVDSWCRLVRPWCSIGDKASKVSGITNQMVNGKKPFSKIMKTVKRKLKDCDFWCAFNESFDRSFIREEFRRNGVKPPRRPVLDPRVICDYLWPRGPNNLDAVVQRLRIAPSKQSMKFVQSGKRHRADYDALLTGIALYLLESKLPSTLRHTMYVQHWMLEQFVKGGGRGYSGAKRTLFPPLPDSFEKNG